MRLRQRQAYSGLLAQNAGYLVEYLLTLAVAPTSHLPELPVRMYGRYLPETIAAAKWALFGNEIESGLLVEVDALSGIVESFYAVTVERRFPNPLVAELLKAGNAPA